VELLVMFTGMLIGAAAASLMALGWATSRLRWLAAHCNLQIAYWRNEANQATAVAAWLREQRAAAGPGPRIGNGDGA
jgi:hypothetical protein